MEPLNAIEIDAIRYRLQVRDQAEQELQARIRAVLASHGAPEGSMIEVRQDNGSMAIAPPPEQPKGE